jgi:hypothetical protein
VAGGNIDRLRHLARPLVPNSGCCTCARFMHSHAYSLTVRSTLSTIARSLFHRSGRKSDRRFGALRLPGPGSVRRRPYSRLWVPSWVVEGFGLSSGVRVWVVSARGRYRGGRRERRLVAVSRRAGQPGAGELKLAGNPDCLGSRRLGLLVIAGTHWCLGRLHAWRRRLLVAKLVGSYSCALTSGSWRRRWRWAGGSRRVGSHIASMCGPVCAIRPPGSAACRRGCRISGWAPRAQRPCAVLPAGTP